MAGQHSWWDGHLEEPGDDVPLEDFAETPMVEWDPVRCHYCGSRRKRTYGLSRHKPVRFHRCLACGKRYRSIESPAKKGG